MTRPALILGADPACSGPHLPVPTRTARAARGYVPMARSARTGGATRATRGGARLLCLCPDVPNGADGAATQAVSA